MAKQDDRQKRHIILESSAVPERFKGTSGRSSPVPAQDRVAHGAALQRQISVLGAKFIEARTSQEEAGLEAGYGLQIEFASFPDIGLALDSLDRKSHGIELLNVRQDESRVLATVFVPDGKLHVLEGLVRDYLDTSKDGTTAPRNSTLLNAIAEIRQATLAALWTDDPAELPTDDREKLWWEVWLPLRRDREASNVRFRQLASTLGFKLGKGEVNFPERTVLLAYGSVGLMKRSMLTLNSIAELRRAKETAAFFYELPPSEQAAWVADLRQRLQVARPSGAIPYVCLLDTGVNSGHPLLVDSLAPEDLHTVEPGWGSNDEEGHGTELAGLALFGDLFSALVGDEELVLDHRLESVKVLRYASGNSDDAVHHGYLTQQAVARPEISEPERRRVFSMAISARDNRDRGRPSTWSATLDQLAADALAQGAAPRLMIQAAGNVVDSKAWPQCPTSNTTDGVHDPAQAWNVLTVGACTDRVDITDTGYEHYKAVAPAGGLSPFSTTSTTWPRSFPIKPDVVFEGGNAGFDEFSAVPLPSLSLLTTNARPQERLLTTTHATSPASALAANMAAQLMSLYPELWPETQRGLITHSAKWTPAMKAAFLPNSTRRKKADVLILLRHCGFGVPDLQRALWSIENSLTLISESTLQPFVREGSKTPKFGYMNLHQLPWPLPELESLGAGGVEMRVTLSYFIEPNPSARAGSAHAYESHRLRFDVKRPAESLNGFRARVNAAARAEQEQRSTTDSDPRWLIGPQNRHRGCLHGDIWRGTAADLASQGVIGVYPGSGWWKTLPHLECSGREARYALLVSIRAPDTEVELYTAVTNRITQQVVTPVEVGTE